MEQNNIITNEEVSEVVSDVAEEVVSTKSKFSLGKALGVSALVAGVIGGIAWVAKKIKAKKAKAQAAEESADAETAEDEEIAVPKRIFDEDGNPIED